MSSAPGFCVFLIGAGALADRALHRQLRRQYEIHGMARAADVERMAHDHPPDVLVCEQQLEDGRGVDLLQRMRVAQPHAVRVLAL